MKDPDNPREDLPGEDPREEVHALYAPIRNESDRKEATIALADGIHQNSTARDYSTLLNRSVGELTHTEILRRNWYIYGSTLKSKDEVELRVQYMVEADRDRTP